ncbi:MAG: helix-turn-helix domain-containing protein [Actinobacteria bacterium]|nr:MAG: helix-turn-helix domain-containing protein [Actinomycetota bacterium]
MDGELLGTAEAARLLGVSRQRVNQMIVEVPDFPAAEAHLSAGRVWRAALVKEWMEAHPDRSRRGRKPQRSPNLQTEK